MKCKEGFTKIFAAVALGIAIIAFTALSDSFGILQFGNIASEPFARLFQILFILFIISPPLMVVLLFLIWKELKARNKMK
ncbi:MAG: hypothetical protein ACR2IA_10065 [Pyrinomonadaceae bacterium]|nr:hypothetical protein [Acidobacteriota bacterium]